ncbi:hypothetical protein [Marinobacter sp. CA1]|uniref:hypothetical protein n=1 Tax=Marinobacter sp. CA1 TaxID=2817656 RepID=UPI001D078BB5|nr:hypothetical protein [Marinobacter sp. CA1]UDL03581.1 hypothetical protein J2887_12595 [Marinobacter sp. CA1]
MFPPAYPHDRIAKLYPSVFLLHGSIRMKPGLRINRNMIILCDAQALTLVNPVRMDDDGLSALEKLGTVKRVIRLGDFHGLDDAFYLDRYQCEFWAQSGQATYRHPQPDTVISANLAPPFPNSEFFIFESAQYPEAALLLRDHQLLITTDSVQYHADWSYFSLLSKYAFRLLGFRLGLNIGPPWLKRVTPAGGSLKTDFERLLELEFEALVSAHGKLLSANAKQMLAMEVHRIFNKPNTP